MAKTPKSGHSADDIPADTISKALQWLAGGHKVALALVLETWGSAPRPRGSMMAVCDDGLFDGSVSGGCVEGEVISTARDLLEEKSGAAAPRTLDFGISNDKAWEVGLACGGKIRIYVEPIGPAYRDLLQELQALRSQKQPAVLALDLASRDHRLIDVARAGAPEKAVETLGRDRAQFAGSGGKQMFFIPFNPPLRLFVVGAVHIAKPLVAMAQYAGFHVTVIDPRAAFLDAAGLGDVTTESEWPDEVLARSGLDRRSALVTLTHDPKLDDAALMVALRSEAFYIGCLGSQRTHGERLRRLGSFGVGETDLERLDGPVGLDIGARSPEEIAVAILAAIIRQLRNPGS